MEKWISKRILKKKYWHSKFYLNSKEIKILNQNDFMCVSCYNNLLEEDDLPFFNDEYGCLCEECYDYECMETCPICEDTVPKEDIEKDFFIISKQGEKELGIEHGIYEVLKKPIYRTDGFSVNFFEKNIKKTSSVSLEDYYIHKRYGDEEVFNCESVCYCCLDDLQNFKK